MYLVFGILLKSKYMVERVLVLLLSKFQTTMPHPENYQSLNRDSWNRLIDRHLQSDFYAMPEFLAGRNSLKEIELGLLGDVRGKSILHLQCHFGQDSLSLQRLGAQVTGADLSDQAIDRARELAERLSLPAQFVCCDLYDLPGHLDQQFDLVFTSYGVIYWLPDLERWGQVIARFLKPGGRFVMAEFHPMVWMFDEDFRQIEHAYFNRGPFVETVSGTYADQEADFKHINVSWSHSLGDVFRGLLSNGLQIEHFQEYDYSPYDCFRTKKVIESGEGRYQIEHLAGKIPMVFSVVAQNCS